MKKLSFKQYKDTLLSKKVTAAFDEILEKFSIQETDSISEAKQEEILSFLNETFQDELLDQLKTQALAIFEEKEEQHESPESLNKGVGSSDAFTRYRSAIKGTHAHRDVLVHDESPFVRYGVAKHGNDTHLDMLARDPDALVRENVALRGNLSHTKLLKNDKSLAVREAAMEREHALHGRNWLGHPKSADLIEDTSMSGLEYTDGTRVRVDQKDSEHHGMFGKIAGGLKVTGPIYNLQFPSGKLAIFASANLSAEDGLPQDVSSVVDAQDLIKAGKKV